MENSENSEIEKLWNRYDKYPKCNECENEKCSGHTDYKNLCGNVNYLRMHGKANYAGNYETFTELKKLIKDGKPSIFSFGCGLGLDYLGAVENFGNNVVYYPIDECKWVITDTPEYKNSEYKLPKKFLKFEDGMMLLSMTSKNPVLCFFHSLCAIDRNVDNLKEKLISVLQSKSNFYIVCNFTINSTCGLMVRERDFIADLKRDLSKWFSLKEIDILNERGIIIQGKRK